MKKSRVFGFCFFIAAGIIGIYAIIRKFVMKEANTL